MKLREKNVRRKENRSVMRMCIGTRREGKKVRIRSKGRRMKEEMMIKERMNKS